VVPVATPPGSQPAVQPGYVQQPVQQTVQAPQTGAPARGPDFGQGHPGETKLTGLAAGREQARRRFNITTSTTQQ
jgi:hypothetical protein